MKIHRFAKIFITSKSLEIQRLDRTQSLVLALAVAERLPCNSLSPGESRTEIDNIESRYRVLLL